jgi:hypothetical protein
MRFGDAGCEGHPPLARDPPRNAATIRSSAEHASTKRAITAL